MLTETLIFLRILYVDSTILTCAMLTYPVLCLRRQFYAYVDTPMLT